MSTASFSSTDDDDENVGLLLEDDDDDSRKKMRNSDKKSSKKKKQLTDEEREELFLQRYMQEMEEQRRAFLKKWREENDRQKQKQKPIQKSCSFLSLSSMQGSATIMHRIKSFLATVEVLICNMPLTIGAVGLGWVTMGVVWFKFMEENLDACTPARFHSDECDFPEFPGCFACDTTNNIYQVVLAFHLMCNAIGGFCCLIFLMRVAWAWQVVADELNNPATMTPLGVVCITMVCVFAGRGTIGLWVVIVTSAVPFVLAFWFLYQAIFQFRLLPDPGWFPNTVGIAYAAIKMWLYYPHVGKFLMVLAMIFLFTMYPISLYRVAFTKKIAAPVCFIQLSAPSITMYAMTIISQPSRQREEQLEASPALLQHYYEMHHRLYLPIQHFMMILSLIAMVSVLQSLYARWPKFSQHQFSPAHIAFVFPILSHTNAVQAYRSGVDAFSTFPPGSPFKIVLYSYWCVCLVVGTTVNLIFTYKYVKRLPKWTKINVTDEEEEEPPLAPNETMVHEMLVESNVHETMTSQFVSPAVLQANEAGQLVRVRRGSVDWTIHGPYVRTRKVTALGFDLIMSEMELRQERAELLDWVAKNKPRSRSKTLSIPMMMKLTSKYDGMDIYGTFGEDVAVALLEQGRGGSGGGGGGAGNNNPLQLTHSRSKTML